MVCLKRNLCKFATVLLMIVIYYRTVAKSFAESEFEKYRMIQDSLFESDFDKEIKRIKGK